MLFILAWDAIANYYKLCELNNKHLFLTVLESKCSRWEWLTSKILAFFLEGHLLSVFSHSRMGKGTLWSLLIRALFSFMRAPPHNFPKVPPSNIITWYGIRVSIHEFWGETNIHSIVLLFSLRPTVSQKSVQSMIWQ